MAVNQSYQRKEGEREKFDVVCVTRLLKGFFLYLFIFIKLGDDDVILIKQNR